MAQRRARGKRNAAILVLTLWIVVVLGLLSTSMLEEVYLELKLARFQRNDFEAMALARAGLARGIADLRNDLLLDHWSTAAPCDAFGDVWAQRDDKIDIELGRGTFSVWVEDESAKLNLNVAGNELLRTVFLELDVKEKEADELTAAIVDWRDPGDDAMPPATGMEDEYYSSVASKASGKEWRKDDPLTYRCKNDKFSSVDELLSIHGITSELYYGVDLEEETPLNPIEQLKARTAEAERNRHREPKYGLRDIFTVDSLGPINVNTAHGFTLRALFRSASKDRAQAKRAADKIVQQRRRQGRGSAANENAFRKVADLVTIGEVPAAWMAAIQKASRLSVKSDRYRIWALGEVGDTQHLICAIVARRFESVTPDQVRQFHDKGVVNDLLMQSFLGRHRDRKEKIEQAIVQVVRQWEL